MTHGFLGSIADINLSLYASSWGRLQCTAEEAGTGKVYNSWAGRPEQEITLQMIVDAINMIDEQIQKEVE